MSQENWITRSRTSSNNFATQNNSTIKSDFSNPQYLRTYSHKKEFLKVDEENIRYPKTDCKLINKRPECFQSFQTKSLTQSITKIQPFKNFHLSSDELQKIKREAQQIRNKNDSSNKFVLTNSSQQWENDGPEQQLQMIISIDEGNQEDQFNEDE